MSATLAWYEAGDSWLHRMDPRPKLVLAAAGTIALVAVLSIPVILTALTLVHLALLSAGIPPRRVLGLWRTLGPLLAIIAVLQPLFSPQGETVLVEVWIVRVTAQGVALALALALRLVAITCCWYLLLMTTRQSALVEGLVRLGLPASWGLVVAMALRYPATLQELYVTVLQAQRSRGLRLEGRGLLGRARAQLPVLIAMLVATLRSIDQLAMALEARGFGGPARRSSLRALAMRPTDWLALGVILAGAAGLVAARVAWGFGARPLAPWG
jgi:energy-coupling factor transport system permease protein